ncbi:hypothetical protein GCM10022254_40800 [Actinomadura meridiana]|uniref:DUF4240 domain-containing protein n=1 Tax=Actinomadura meridiana TaxID=559626 RepID=A0ABP8C737_9ACTN
MGRVIDFWDIIGLSSAQSADDVRSTLGRVSGRLGELAAADLVKFFERLHEALNGLDRGELAEIPVFVRGQEWPQSSDHFLYARCACVLAGRDAYDASLRSSSEFARFVQTFFQTAEELLSLAPAVHERRVGREMDMVGGPTP